jgi:mono/diheme cytochrome c family protein
MLSHPMPRARRLLLIAAAVVGLSTVAACGEQGISAPKGSAQRAAADIFVLHCSGCHTLAQAGTQGSATNVRTREYKDGPNFNQRHETVNCVLYAIRNGGFSSGPMPQDILTGNEAKEVAQYVAENSKGAATGATAVKVPDCPAG